MASVETLPLPVRKPSPLAGLKTYREFIRIGFVNILAFRLRYYTGIVTYLINVTVYYFIWRAVFANAAGPIAGFSLPQILTYVSVGWILRSFYWNTIDQEMAYEVIEGKIAMDFIKPVSVQWMWLARAMGESAFRLILLTAPTAIVIALLFPVLPPVSKLNFAFFLIAAIYCKAGGDFANNLRLFCCGPHRGDGLGAIASGLCPRHSAHLPAELLRMPRTVAADGGVPH